MENAISQIREYVSGNRDATMEYLKTPLAALNIYNGLIQAAGRMLYNLLIEGRFPYAVWTLPVPHLLIVLAFVAAATLAAIHAPAKRICSMAITATINEL